MMGRGLVWDFLGRLLDVTDIGSRWLGYVLAPTAAILALVVRSLFDPLLGDSATFLLSLLSVLFVAWKGGFGPAVVATLVGAAGVSYLFLEPRHSFLVEKLSDKVSVVIFLASGVGCALLGEVQRQAVRRSRHRQADLQNEVFRRREVEERLRNREAELITRTGQLGLAERHTTEALALLDAFLLNAPLGMAFHDRNLRYVRVNRYLAEANGVPIEAHLGKTAQEVLPDLPAELLVDYRHVLDTGEAFLNRRLTLPGHSGPDRPTRWEVSLFPVRRPDGETIGLGMLARDITAALRAEEQVRESEARFRSLAELVPQIVWVTRPDGYHEFYNQRWYDYTGLSEHESIGFGWSVSLHPDDRERSVQRWKQATDTGEPYEIEYRFRNAEGAYRWFLGRALPHCDNSGRIVRWFGTCTDIDDRKRQVEEQRRHAETLERLVCERTAELLSALAAQRAEIEQRQRLEEAARAVTLELERSNRELEQFAYVASHDLQEPLRKIQAFGDRLRTRFREQLGESGKDYLDRMLTSATRMRRLIDDLLAFSRVSTRPQVLTPVHLDDVAREVVSDLEARIAQAEGSVEVGPLPTIDADRLQMRQLFQNLLANALKFHRCGVPPAVTIRAEPCPAPAGVQSVEEDDKTGWRFTVEDNGIGFEEKYLDRIFQVFQRLHGRDGYEGTGVGLAICRKIVERHGGSITAQSQPGLGARFIVVLPARQRKKEPE